MGVRMITPANEIELKIMTDAQKRRKVIVDTMCYVGEMCIAEARTNGSYTDQTGNLRSSIGYVVLVDGMVYQQNYADQVLNGVDGAGQSKSFLQKQALKARKSGIVLMVAAGMNYAEMVEARGYNVLSSAQLMAERAVPRILIQLGFKAKK